MGLLVLRVAGVPTEHHQQTQGPCRQSFQTGNDILVFSVWEFKVEITIPRQKVVSWIITQVWSRHSEVLDESVHRVAQQLNKSRCSYNHSQWSKSLEVPSCSKSLQMEPKSELRNLKLLSCPLEPSRHLVRSLRKEILHEFHKKEICWWEVVCAKKCTRASYT